MSGFVFPDVRKKNPGGPSYHVRLVFCTFAKQSKNNKNNKEKRKNNSPSRAPAGDLLAGDEGATDEAQGEDVAGLCGAHGQNIHIDIRLTAQLLLFLRHKSAGFFEGSGVKRFLFFAGMFSAQRHAGFVN